MEPDLALFHEANRNEIQFLWDKNTWDLVDLPAEKTITGTQMLSEGKRGATGAVERYKRRLVAHGDTQLYMVDYQYSGPPSRAMRPCGPSSPTARWWGCDWDRWTSIRRF